MQPRSDTRFQIRSDMVAAKVIDGEAIVINVATGRYYSLEGAGEAVWSAISDGPLSASEIARRLAEAYEVDEGRARADVEQLASELVAQDLVAEAAPAGPDGSEFPPAPGSPPVAGRLPYAPPRLAVFTDLEDLLAFDPPLPAPPPEAW